ncbi:MAG TPA: hypothetical protein VFB54_15835 [Burkholderiales bacterium]|nr:hypothetical protein [Burkholderiales bacterium]
MSSSRLPRSGADDRRLLGLAVFLILVGLLLGPGYYLYWRYLSGEDTATLELTERADRFTLPDGTIQRYRSGPGYRPVPLALHPERNQIRLSLRFDFPAGAAQDSTNTYLLTVYDGDFPIVQREFTVPARPGSSERVVVPPFSTRSPLDHSMTLEELGKPSLPASRVTVTVRENVTPLLSTYAWSGAALLLVGIVLYVIEQRRW